MPRSVFLKVPLAPDVDHARRRGVVGHRDALERLGHEVDPDRQAQAAPGFAAAQVARRVVAHPCRSRHGGLIAHEPGVHRIVGGASLAVQIGPLERRLRTRSGAAAGDLLQQAAHQERIALVDRSSRLVQHDGGRFVQHLAPALSHFGDQLRCHAVASVGKHCVARDHLHRCDRPGPQGHGQVGRVFVGIEPETGDPFLRALGAHQLQHADGHHVLGLGECAAHRHRTVELAVVVLGFPGLAAGLACAVEQRRVVDHRHRCHALFQCR